MQNETNQPVNKVDAIKEAPRLAGSCPMIFTWNGSRFQFITDVLGVAPLGASSGDGEYFPVDHDEYVSIPGRSAPAARWRLRNPHHRGTARGLLSRPDQADGARSPGGDRDRHQREIQVAALSGVPPVRRRRAKSIPWRRAIPTEPMCAPPLLQRDRVYPDSFRRDQAGVAELHQLDLDFGDAARCQPRRADSLRLGGLGRRQHFPFRHPGAPRSGLSLSPGEGRRRAIGRP